MKRHFRYAASCGLTTSGSCPTQGILHQMLQDLLEEVSRWDLVPKPTSLWWTSTYDREERIDMTIYTTKGGQKFLFEEKFKILGDAMNRQGKSHDAMKKECSQQTRLSGRIF